jgi:hypothetical protein
MGSLWAPFIITQPQPSKYCNPSAKQALYLYAALSKNNGCLINYARAPKKGRGDYCSVFFFLFLKKVFLS